MFDNSTKTIKSFLSKALSKLQPLFTKLILKNIEVQGDKTVFYTDSSKTTITSIKYKDGTAEYYENGVLNIIDYRHCPSEKNLEIVKYEKDGRTVGMKMYKNETVELYKNGVLNCIDYTSCPSEKTYKYKYFEDDGKTIRSIFYKDGHYERYENGKLDFVMKNWIM